MLLIIQMHLDFVASRESVHKRHAFIPTCVFDHDIRNRLWVLILRTSLIQVSKIDADSDLPILVGNQDDVGHPVWVLLFLDETRVYELLDF